MRNIRPLVSFTFDDVPESAYTNGARILESHGCRGTFYIAPGLCGRQDDHWRVISRDQVKELHRGGHEVACHTYRHASVQLLSGPELGEETRRTREALTEICGSPPSNNFAYPYGVASWPGKLGLERTFDSCRGTHEGINRRYLDLGQLLAVGLYDRTMSEQRLSDLMSRTKAANGWLIFLTHDVDDPPSWIGSSPALLESALRAAEAHGVASVTVDQALREIRG